MPPTPAALLTLPLLVLGASTAPAPTVRAPALAFPDGWRWEVRGASVSVRMQVTNLSDETRTLCFSASRQAGISGNPNNVTTADAGVPACQTMRAGEVRTLPVGFTMANGTLDGDAVNQWIQAYDQAAPSLATSTYFKTTVAMNVTAPAAESLREGQSYTRAFRVHNISPWGQTYTYRVTVASSNSAVLAGASAPASVSIAAGGYLDVPVTFSIPLGQGGKVAALSLSVGDVNFADRMGSAGATYTAVAVSARPTLSWLTADPTVDPGVAYTNTLRVRNNATDTRTLCFRDALGAGNAPAASVLSAYPPNPGCQPLAAGQTRDIPIPYTASPTAQAGWWASYGFTAYDRDATAYTSETATFSAHVNTRLAAPAVSGPASVNDAPGVPRTVSFTVKNNSNASRSFALVATSSATGVVPDPADPGTVTLAAFAEQGFSVTYTPRALGTATVKLRATDTGDAARADSAAFTSSVTGVREPSLTSVVRVQPMSAGAGTTYRLWYTLVNQSSQPRGYTFRAVEATGTLAFPGQQAPVTLAVKEARPVHLDFTVPAGVPEGALRTVQFEAHDAAGDAFGVATSAVQVRLSGLLPVVSLRNNLQKGSAGERKSVWVRLYNPQPEPQHLCLNWMDDEGGAGQTTRPEPTSACQVVAARDTAWREFTYQFKTTALAGTLDRQVVQAYTILDADRVAQAELRTQTVAGTGNSAPTASFTYSPAAPLPGDPVTFSGFHSSDPDEGPLTYAWSFGDGTTATGVTAQKSYAALGTYAAQLTVSDGRGGTHTATKTVTVVRDADQPTITFNRPLSLTQPTPGFQLTIDWRDNRALDLGSMRILFNGADVTRSFATTTSWSNWSQSSTTLQLARGSNTIRASIADTTGNVATLQGVYTYAPTEKVSITPSGTTVQAPQGSTGLIQRFVVKNEGDTQTRYVLAAGCPDSLTAVYGCTSQTPWLDLPAGVSMSVDVRYGTRPTLAAGRLGLNAHKDGDGSIWASGSVSVQLTRVGPPAPPTVTAPASPVTLVAGDSRRLSFTLGNPGLAGTFALAVDGCGGPVTCGALSTTSLTLGSGGTGSFSFPVVAAYVGSATLRVTARQVGVTGVPVGEALLTVQVGGSGQSPTVTLDSATSIPLVERDQCLSIALGSDAAYECGDLRLVHALPTTRTLNRARTPVLLYNSQHAEPHPLVGATIAIPANAGATPSTVTATLRLEGMNSKPAVQRSWTGWAPGQSRRVAISDSSLQTLPTGVYPYTLQLSAVYAGTPRPAAPISGWLVVVNRKQSPFGAGWWVAGVERLYFQTDTTKILWVGGDGSTRVYTRVSDEMAWVAPSVDRPDSLRADAGKTEYVRELPGGVKVKFDYGGRHVATENRLRHLTRFTYCDSTDPYRLAQIQLPLPPGSSEQRTYTYDFTCGAGNVVVTAPSGPGTSRQTTLVLQGGRLTRVQDPDQSHIDFRYEAGGASSRVDEWLDRLQVPTHFAYDAGKRLSQTRLVMERAEDDIVNLFRPQESRGADGPLPLDSLYTLWDGPRTDVADTTKFWLDRFGAPARIHDALGHETRLTRGDPAFPALVTELRAPNGFVTRATYDARGNLKTSTQVNPLLDSRDAQIVYAYESTVWPDFVTRVETPEKVVFTTTYDPASGDRLTQQNGLGALSEVRFTYDPSTGLLQTVTTPEGRKRNASPLTYTYDPALGNLSTETTPRLAVTEHKTDGIGGDTALYVPLDSQRKMHTYVVYNAAGRDSITTTDGDPSVGNLVVRKSYDAEGRLLSVGRKTDPATVAIGEVVNTTVYDHAGRVIREIAPDGKEDRFFYDGAGNPDTMLTRRGHTITMTYDALNRLLTRRVPEQTYRQENTIGIPAVHPTVGCTASSTGYEEIGKPYPRIPNALASDGSCQYRIPEVTEKFGYDEAGSLILASNLDAVVRRSYYPNGALRSDTLEIATTAGTSDGSHRYVLRYLYDRDGRRTDLKYDAGMPGLSSQGVSTRYTYDPLTGALKSIMDPRSGRYVYEYDDDGRLVHLYRGDAGFGIDAQGRPLRGLIDNYEYDNDGLLVSHSVGESLTGVSRHARLDETARYTLGGKMYQLEDSVFFRNDATTLPIKTRILVQNEYTLLGHLGRSAVTTSGWFAGSHLQSTGSTAHTETFTYDAMANRLTSSFTNSGFDSFKTGTRWASYRDYSDWLEASDRTAYHYLTDGTGRLHERVRVDGTVSIYDTLTYNAAGDVEKEVSRENGKTRDGVDRTGNRHDRVSYYGADGKLRATDVRTWEQTSRDRYEAAFTEYRYDALGRRVWVRSQNWCYGNDDDPSYICNQGSVQRVVWDGEQPLYEIRMPETARDATQREKDSGPIKLQKVATDHTTFDLNPFYGRVLYVHGGELDQPVGIVRFDYQDGILHKPYVVGGERQYPDIEVPDSTKIFAPLPFVMFPMWDLRGQPLGSGIALDCASLGATDQYRDGVRRCVTTNWMPQYQAYGQLPAGERSWHGSLLQGSADGNGLMYRRNRYYDPSTGRFTQEDPIGVAGGVNLYGYAAGDPVNYSDPFGLSLCKDSRGKEIECPDVAKVLEWMRANAHERSRGQCAKYCRQGLEAGGFDAKGRPVAAGDYGPFLQSRGAVVVPSKGYVARAGDIVVFNKTKEHPYGHIAIFDGHQWISDFKQNNMIPYRNRESAGAHTIYRFPSSDP